MLDGMQQLVCLAVYVVDLLSGCWMPCALQQFVKYSYMLVVFLIGICGRDMPQRRDATSF